MTFASVLLVLAKATVVLVAALGLARALHRAPAGSRHLVWLAALGAMLLVPGLAAWGPLRLAVLPAPPAAAAPVVAPEVPPLAAPSSVAADAADAGIPTAAAHHAGPGLPLDATPTGSPDGWTLAERTARRALAGVPLALAVWAAVALAIGASLVHAWLAVRRIVRRARPLDGRGWLDPLYEIADRLALDEAPRLLRSEDAKMPFACGIARPTVVLPAESDGWSADRRRAVLLHELAHVRRRDLVGHTLARVVCAVYWFHPLVWTAARRLRAESERACDDLALSCGARASDYAEHLLDIVTSVRRDATPLVAMAMARRNEFEGRMLDILDPERPRSTPERWHAAALVGALAVVTVVVGAAAPAPAAPAPHTAPHTASPFGASVGVPTVRRDTSPAAPADAPALPAPRDPRDVRDPRAPRDARSAPDAPAMRDAAAPPSVRAPELPAAPEPLPSVSPVPTPTPTPRPTPNSTPNPTSDVVVLSASGAAPTAASAATVGRVRALLGLGGSAPARADDRVDLLAKVLRSDSSASLRRIAAWGLAQHSEEATATDALATALRADASAAVREMAAWALASGHARGTARDALAAALRADAEPKVRETAAWSLGTLGLRNASDALVAALGDASADVRGAAAWALGNVHPQDAPSALLALLRDRDPGTRRVAAWALFNIQDPASIPALRSALRAESDARLRGAYVRALAALGERSVDALTELLESSDAETRAVAVRALAGRASSSPWVWPWPRPRPYP